jgi:hypothetical protein
MTQFANTEDDKHELDPITRSSSGNAQPRHSAGARHRHVAEGEQPGYRAGQASVIAKPSIAEIIEDEWPRMEAAMRYLADR